MKALASDSGTRPTQRLTLMAMLAAMSAAIHYLPSLPSSALLSFSGFPIILSGFLLGPAGGFWCGVIADLVSYVVHPMGAYFPGFTLTSGLTGALPVAFYRAGLQQPYPLVWWRVTLCVLLSQLSVKLLVSAFRALLYPLPFSAIAFQALVEQAVHAPLYAYGVYLILRRAAGRSRQRVGSVRWRRAEDQQP